MTTLQMRPLSEHVGVEASGVDLKAVDDATFASLQGAVADHGVLFVRDQELTPEQHIAFARRWGAIDVNNTFPRTAVIPRSPKCARPRTSRPTSAAAGTPTTATIRCPRWDRSCSRAKRRRAGATRCSQAGGGV